MATVVCTRHESLIQFLKEEGLIEADAQVIAHPTVEDVQGNDVIGILPINLAALTNSFTHIPLDLPFELRGKELTISQFRQFCGKPVTYKVAVVKGGKHV